MIRFRLSHQELAATMIYTHTLKRGRGGARSSAEGVLAIPAGTFGWIRLAAAQPVAPRTHIVYIVSDDHGWKDVGFHGSNIKTASLDQLGQSRTRLEQVLWTADTRTVAGGPHDRPLPFYKEQLFPKDLPPHLQRLYAQDRAALVITPTSTTSWDFAKVRH